MKPANIPPAHDTALSAEPVESLAERLVASLRQFSGVAVALSGGVDSCVVARAAREALGQRAIAVTGVSASLAAGELQLARDMAALIGINHRVVSTRELDRAGYVANQGDRCYHCKTELYTRLGPILAELQLDVVLNGANHDDLGDYRPGMRAAREFRVVSPLLELGLGKGHVRALAAYWNLPVWNKPATPCLASRIALGEAVSPDKLHMIDLAEQFLRRLGLDVVRVRYHQGAVARLEVPLEALPRLCQPDLRGKLVDYFKQLGFQFVTLDLEGFRSGSLNTALVQLQL